MTPRLRSKTSSGISKKGTPSATPSWKALRKSPYPLWYRRSVSASCSCRCSYSAEWPATSLFLLPKLLCSPCSHPTSCPARSFPRWQCTCSKQSRPMLPVPEIHWCGSSGRSSADSNGFGTPITPCSQRSEEHTSELQSPDHLVCRLLLEKKKTKNTSILSAALERKLSSHAL